MSQATVIEFGPDKKFMNLAFPDLEAKFEQHLESIRSIADLENLIEAIKPLFRDKRFSSDEVMRLRKLRQRAYDRKRNHKVPVHRSVEPPQRSEQITSRFIGQRKPSADDNPLIQTPTPSVGTQMTETHANAAIPNCESASFVDGVVKRLSKVDGERFIETVPKLIICLSAAAVVSFFLWHQSLGLYSSAGFANATYAAAGGILMIVGFAAYHSLSRSWLALLCCLYAGAYESYLMVSGTIHDDIQTRVDSVQSNPELVLLQEKVDKEHSHYLELKQRYENPESKVFKNEWYLKTHLNPAWEANVAANRELVEKRATLTAEPVVNHVTCLKILYRLGLVFLCMMLFHHFFASCSSKNFAESKFNA